MEQNASFTNNIDTLFSDLHNFVKTDSVLGAPMTVAEKTIIPLMSVTLGYGSTGAGMKNQNNASSNTAAGGVGLGARVSTNGIVVIDKNSVQVIPTSDKTNMSQLMDKIPQAISSMGQNMMQGGTSQSQQQSKSQNQQGAQQGSSNA